MFFLLNTYKALKMLKRVVRLNFKFSLIPATADAFYDVLKTTFLAEREALSSFITINTNIY